MLAFGLGFSSFAALRFGLQAVLSSGNQRYECLDGGQQQGSQDGIEELGPMQKRQPRLIGPTVMQNHCDWVI